MEEMHKSIDSSSSGFDPDPNDSVHQSPAYEVNFGFNQLKIDENKPQSAADEVNFGFNSLKIDENDPQSTTDEVNLGFNKLKIDENEPQSTTDEVNFGFNNLKIDENEPHKQQLMAESAENEEEEEDDDEEEGEFTFMCIGENDSLTEELFENGQIRPVFPLFDQSLLFGGDNDGDGKLRLPIHVPVDKVFIESPRRSPSSTASGDEKTDGVTTATICAALPNKSDSGTPEINIKSNSTGFSKLWRFRDKMNRSNSDGRDAFVFLETPQRISTTTPSTSTAIGKANAGGDDFPAKVTGAGGGGGGGKGKVVNKKGSKVKKVKASAHEVYLKQRGGQTEDERRRSYLPYRPGLMGFFTNVNGGLSKNVHPF